MGYYIDQLAEQDMIRRLSELLAMQQDNTDPGVTFNTGVPDQRQEFLSALADPRNTIRTEGFDQLGTTGRGEPYMPPQPLPQNYIRNERTGAVTDLGPSRQPVQSMDYSSPVEIGGYGKGYRLKGDSTRAILADGRIVSFGRDTGADRARMKEDLALEKSRAEIDQMKSKPGSSMDKVLADVYGEKIKATIPGTAEYDRVEKRQAAEKKEQTAWSGAIQQADTMDDYIDRVLGQGKYEKQGSKLGYFATGLPGQILENFGGTDARNLRGDLDRIKANIGFDELNKMRRESPTGGALGQVTERELQFLQSVQGALDQAQSPEQLERMLWDIKLSTQRLKQDLKANPPKGFSGGTQGAQSGAQREASLMQEAQDAIANGAPKDAVMQRLREMMGR